MGKRLAVAVLIALVHEAHAEQDQKECEKPIEAPLVLHSQDDV
jgi:hypothetical protein